MKLPGYRQTYYDFTGKLSDVTRNAAYAAIALIWIFSPGENQASKKIDPAFLNCLILVVLTLIFDALQYLAGSVIWRFVYRYFEKEGKTEDEELIHDERLPVIVDVFLLLKVISCGVAYFILFISLFKRLVI